MLFTAGSFSGLSGLSPVAVAGPLAGARALELPELNGPVVDEAGLLSVSERADLSRVLLKLYRTGKIQMVIFLPSSLRELDIESFSIQTAEQWKVGRKGQDQGLILVVAPTERKMRLEVGYGLEGVLTDAFSRRVLDQILRPAFRQKQYALGLHQAIGVIAKELKLEGAGAQTGPAKSPAQVEISGLGKFLIYFLVALFVLVFLVVRALGGVSLRGRGRRGKGIWWGGGGGGPGDFPGGGSSSGGGGFSGGGGGFGGGGASSDW